MSEAAAAIAEDPVIQEWIAGVRLLRDMSWPDGFSPARWRIVKDDCAHVLRRHGATLRRLGWSTEDVFGLLTTAPGARVDGWGLAIALRGFEIEEITEAGARIRAKSGATLSYPRVEVAGRVPAWKVPT